MSKLNVYAKLVNKNAGWDADVQKVSNYEVGTLFEVEDIQIGGWSTDVYFVGDKHPYNSVQFIFQDEEGNTINIFKDSRFDPRKRYMV